MVPDDEDRFSRHLKTRCLSGVRVLPAFQKRGMGKSLLQAGSNSLGIPLEDMRFPNSNPSAGSGVVKEFGRVGVDAAFLASSRVRGNR